MGCVVPPPDQSERVQPSGAPASGTGTAPPILADQGFTGRRWRTQWRTAYGTTVLPTAAYDGLAAPTDRHRARHWSSSRRQEIATIFRSLTDRFGIKFPRSRTHWGTWTRLASKVAAFNLAVFVNQLFGRPRFARFNPLD